MSCLRKPLPLAVVLALIGSTTALSPLFAQKSVPPKPPPSSSLEDEPLAPDANSWRLLAKVYEGEVLRLRDERDHRSAETVACQAKLKGAEELLHEMYAKALTAVFDDPEIEVRGSDVFVTARLLNGADEPARGTAFLVLLLDDKVAGTAEEPVNMAANAGAAVTHRFEGAAGKGKLSVSVSFNP